MVCGGCSSVCICECMCVNVCGCERLGVGVDIYIYVMYNIHIMVGRSIADVYSRSATFTEAQVLRYEHLPYPISSLHCLHCEGTAT